MFNNDELNELFKHGHTVKAGTRVFAEINMNSMDNIARIGNYRYRPTGDVFRQLPVAYDPTDAGLYYTDATLSYSTPGETYESGTALSETSLVRQDDDDMADLFPLEDCFRTERPRSGINKAMFFRGRYFDGAVAHANRPRYYIGSKHDSFKYWTSYRHDGDTERGISYDAGAMNLIDDAVPFVVYKSPVPANRLVVKVQTHAGESMGQVMTDDGVIDDPLSVSMAPTMFDLEVLQGGTWQKAFIFNGFLPNDGHFEVGYGMVIPDQFSSYTFKFC